MKTLTLIRDAEGYVRGVRQPAFLLKVLKGPERRRQQRCATPRLTIGTGPNARFRLEDPTVSAAHSEIFFDTEGAWVRDLGSKNGVLLGGRLVRLASLLHKDDLTLGSTTVRFMLLDEEEELAVSADHSFGRLRGRSVRMRMLYDELAKAAASESPVLLSGPTGSGKSLAAEALVTAGPRRDRPWVVVDCARLQPGYADEEFFGRAGGAPGAFERAERGTVLLDRVDDLERRLQKLLIGVLDRQAFVPVGGQRPVALRARILSATGKDLEVEMNRGLFRPDLFHQLAVLHVRLPGLREHVEDADSSAISSKSCPADRRSRPTPCRCSSSASTRATCGSYATRSTCSAGVTAGLNHARRFRVCLSNRHTPSLSNPERAIRERLSARLSHTADECLRRECLPGGADVVTACTYTSCSRRYGLS